MNGHEQIKELIAIYDSLTPAERTRVDQHLESCQICRIRLAAYQKMDDGLELLVDPNPAVSLRADFYAQLQVQRPNRNNLWHSFLLFFRQMSAHVARAGALAVIALLIISMWLTLRNQTEQPAAVPSLPPTVPLVTSTPSPGPTPERVATNAPTPMPSAPVPAWTFQQLTTFSGALNVVRDVTIGEDGRYIAAAGSNANAIIWQQTESPDQYQQRIQKEVLDGALLNSLAFSAPEYLAVGGANSSDGLVSVRNLSNGEEAFYLPSSIPPVKAIAASSTGNIIALGTDPAQRGQNGAVYLWFLQYSDNLYELPFEGETITSLAFSPDAALVAATTNAGVTIWQVTGNELLQTLTAEPDQSPAFSSVAFSPDNQTIAAGTKDGTVYLWQLSTGELLHRLDTGSTTIQSIAYSANSQQLAAVSDSGRVTIWQLDGQTPQHLFSGETAERVRLAADITFIDETVLVAIGLTNGQIQLWQAAPN